MTANDLKRRSAWFAQVAEHIASEDTAVTLNRIAAELAAKARVVEKYDASLPPTNR